MNVSSILAALKLRAGHKPSCTFNASVIVHRLDISWHIQLNGVMMLSLQKAGGLLLPSPPAVARMRRYSPARVSMQDLATPVRTYSRQPGGESGDTINRPTEKQESRAAVENPTNATSVRTCSAWFSFSQTSFTAKCAVCIPRLAGCGIRARIRCVARIHSMLYRL